MDSVTWYGRGTTLTVPYSLGYCPWCSQPHLGSYVYHGAACPKVKAIEYYPNGMIKRIEFFGQPPTQTYVVPATTG